MEVQGVAGEQPWLYAVGDVNGISPPHAHGQVPGPGLRRPRRSACAGREPDTASSMTPFATGLGSPQVVFTDPEVAATGLTEEQARGRGIRVRVVDLPMDSAAGSGLQAEGYQGQARIVVDEDAESSSGPPSSARTSPSSCTRRPSRSSARCR